MFYQVIKAGREEIGLVWNYEGKKIKIEKIYLPLNSPKMAERIMEDFPEIVKKPHGIPDGIESSDCRIIRRKEN